MPEDRTGPVHNACPLATPNVIGSANKKHRAPDVGVSTIIAIQYTVSFNSLTGGSS
jgi:hypothetical protein